MTLEDLIRIIIEKHNLCKKWFGFTDDDFYTKEQLTKKYHELAKNYHADITNGTDDDMKAINEAYAWLKRFVKDPKDKKYVFYDENLKKLKDDFDSIFYLLKEPYNRHRLHKTGARLFENRRTILKQIQPIYEVLKNKFQIIDVYLRNNQESSVAKFIKDRVNELANANKFELWHRHYSQESNLYLAGRNFSESMIDYHEDFRYLSDSEKGFKREYMRKCRNEALVELLNFTKEMQKFLLMINNGFVEITEDYNDSNGIINLTYIADYEKLNNCFSDIRNSGNYFCYISEEEKKILSKKK